VCAADTAGLYALSRLGRSIADQRGCLLRVLLFAKAQQQCEENARLLEDVFECAKRMDAEMNVLYTDHPMERLLRDRSACLVMMDEEKLTEQLRQAMPEKKLVVMR
jgi:K+-sensing histidine kinase KdpD